MAIDDWSNGLNLPSNSGFMSSDHPMSNVAQNMVKHTGNDLEKKFYAYDSPFWRLFMSSKNKQLVEQIRNEIQTATPERISALITKMHEIQVESMIDNANQAKDMLRQGNEEKFKQFIQKCEHDLKMSGIVNDSEQTNLSNYHEHNNSMTKIGYQKEEKLYELSNQRDFDLYSTDTQSIVKRRDSYNDFMLSSDEQNYEHQLKMKSYEYTALEKMKEEGIERIDHQRSLSKLEREQELEIRKKENNHFLTMKEKEHSHQISVAETYFNSKLESIKIEQNSFLAEKKMESTYLLEGKKSELHSKYVQNHTKNLEKTKPLIEKRIEEFQKDMMKSIENIDSLFLPALKRNLQFKDINYEIFLMKNEETQKLMKTMTDQVTHRYSIFINEINSLSNLRAFNTGS